MQPCCAWTASKSCSLTPVERLPSSWVASTSAMRISGPSSWPRITASPIRSRAQYTGVKRCGKATQCVPTIASARRDFRERRVVSCLARRAEESAEPLGHALLGVLSLMGAEPGK
jgi:hypothetical protein